MIFCELGRWSGGMIKIKVVICNILCGVNLFYAIKSDLSTYFKSQITKTLKKNRIVDWYQSSLSWYFNAKNSFDGKCFEIFLHSAGLKLSRV